MADKPTDSSRNDQSQQKNNPNRENLNPEVSNLTPDSQSVQDQEVESASPVSPSEGGIDGKVEKESADIVGSDNDENQILASNLKQFETDLAKLMAWKEDLKLKCLGANINLAYYHLWRTDANILFQRCVILRKRLQKYAKNKGV
ncbi:MAG: hypothetical protein ACOH5I_24935 [Oligoflexus sp.]